MLQDVSRAKLTPGDGWFEFKDTVRWSSGGKVYDATFDRQKLEVRAVADYDPSALPIGPMPNWFFFAGPEFVPFANGPQTCRPFTGRSN